MLALAGWCSRRRCWAPRAGARRWALALQVAVLAATVLAWAKAYVHSFKASLWGLAAVVTFACIISCNLVYAAWPWSTVSEGACRGALAAALHRLRLCTGACAQARAILSQPRHACAQGRTHDSLVATLYGMAVLVAANFLMMVLGDAL